VLSGFILLLAGNINMNFHKLSVTAAEADQLKKETFLVRIAEVPEILEKGVRTTAIILGSGESGIWKPKYVRKILVYIEKDSLAECLAPGDRIWIHAGLANIPPPANPDEFNYSRYLSARNIFSQAYLQPGSWRKSAAGREITLQVRALQVRSYLLEEYEKIGLNRTLNGLLEAITLGYRNDLESHTKQVFSRAGVMHVMALSGFNVGIIALSLSFLLGIFNGSLVGRIFKTLVIILFIWLFTFVTGFSPSVTRAAAMISLVLTGGLLNRQVNTTNILFASAFIILAISPAMLYDASFQLSFAAVTGIIFLYPLIGNALSFKHTLPDKIWKLFSLSCAAQLATLPVTLFYFHQFPVYFWLTNLYVVPLVSLIVIIAGIFLLLSWWSLPAVATGKVLAIALGLLNKSVSIIEVLPYSLIEHIRINLLQVFTLILIIICAVCFLYFRRKALFLACLMFVVLLQASTAIQHGRTARQRMIMVGKLKGVPHVQVLEGNKCLLLSDKTLDANDSKLLYAFENFWIEHGVASGVRMVNTSETVSAFPEMPGISYAKIPGQKDDIMLDVSGFRLIYLYCQATAGFHYGSRLHADMVIVSGKRSPDLKALLQFIDTPLLILDSTVSRWQAEQWISSCRQAGLSCWNISEKGAYVLYL
jgi:competence protein ComEC